MKFWNFVLFMVLVSPIAYLLVYMGCLMNGMSIKDAEDISLIGIGILAVYYLVEKPFGDDSNKEGG